MQEWITRESFGGVVSGKPVVYDEGLQEMARGLVDSWMGSPPHRTNILDRSSSWIGGGVSVHLSEEYGFTLETVYPTQNFGSC